MVSGQAPNIADPGRLPGLHELQARDADLRRPVPRHRVRVPGPAWRRSPTSSRARATRWKGYMEGMNGAAAGREQPLPPSRDQLPGQHPDRRGRRPVRGSPQPVRLLPLDHRLPDLRSATTSATRTCARTCVEADDPQLLVHHPEPLPRRPRLAVRQRRARRPRSADRWLRDNVPQILRSPAFKHRRASDRHLRRGRGRRRRRRLQRLLQRAAGPQPTPEPRRPEPGPGRRPDRRRPVSPCIKPGTVDDDPLQPLLAAALDRAQLAASLPGLRRTAGACAARPQGAQPARAASDQRAPAPRRIPFSVMGTSRRGWCLGLR